MRMTEHLRLEVAAAVWYGKPLAPGAPVPGCSCPDCTGVPADAPARRPTPRRDLRPALDVDGARDVPIIDVAARLGIEHRRGWARCPFHEDTHPSFHLNSRKGRAFCNVCARSWDSIGLLMEMANLTFVEAVRELTGSRAA
jgi:hypothetical protein